MCSNVNVKLLILLAVIEICIRMSVVVVGQNNKTCLTWTLVSGNQFGGWMVYSVTRRRRGGGGLIDMRNEYK